MNIRVVKAKRIGRKLPLTWWRLIKEPIFNSGQLLTALVGILGLVIYLRYASPEERDVQAFEWAVTVQAFVLALAIWAVISLIRAPLIIIREDRKLGNWEGNRFIFRRPFLIYTRHCKPTGKVEAFKFKVSEVEPGSYIKFEIDLDGAKDLAEISFGGIGFLGPIPYKNWPGTGGAQLPADRVATFLILLPNNAVSTTVRIYCRSFVVGKLDDQDGAIGNHQFPVGSPLASDDWRGSA